MRWNEKIYTLYIGEENVCDGTLPEIARKTGRTIDALRFMTYPSYQKQLAQRKTDNVSILIPLDDNDDDWSLDQVN